MKQIYLFLLLSILINTSVKADDTKPFLEKKIVLAYNSAILNYSANMGFLKGMQYKSLYGIETDSIQKKYCTYLPLVSEMVNPMTLEDALAFEMIAAKEMGIDGFKFPLFLNAHENFLDRFIKVITTYIKVAEDRNIQFTFSLQMDIKRNPEKVSENQLYTTTVKRLIELYKKTNYSKKWLRNTDDEIVLFTNNTNHIIDKTLRVRNVENFKKNRSLIRSIKDQFDRIESEVGAPFAVIFQSTFLTDIEFNNLVLDHFPGIIPSRFQYNNAEDVRTLREICKKRNRPLFQMVMPDYMGVQLLSKKDNKRIKRYTKLEEAYVAVKDLDLTGAYRDFLEDAVQNDVDLIDLYSWNYFGEGTHIAPEIHHGFSYGILLKYYKKLWMKEDTNTLLNEYVLTSYKGYHSDNIENTDINIRKSSNRLLENTSNNIEVVCLLKEEASIYCNNQYLGDAQKGLTVFHTPLQVGKVRVKAKRNGKKFIEYQTNKEILEQPRKTDWLTYSFSNVDAELGHYFQKITLEFEMVQLKKRFLINNEQQRIWKTALQDKYNQTINAAYLYGYNEDNKKFTSLKKEYEKEYRNKIKKILNDFEYEIWIEMEEESQLNKGVVNINSPINEALEGYNVLEAY